MRTSVGSVAGAPLSGSIWMKSAAGMARCQTGSSRRPSSVMRSSTPSRAAGIVRRSGTGGCCARAMLEVARMRNSAQRYREISGDVMRWKGSGAVGPVLLDRPVCLLSYDGWCSSVSRWESLSVVARRPSSSNVLSCQPPTETTTVPLREQRPRHCVRDGGIVGALRRRRDA